MLSEMLISTLQILSSFYLTLVLLRFLLQVARADFYNPISQFVVKATNPLLRPLRRLVPGWGGIDGAALLLAVLIQGAVFFLILLATGFSGINPAYLLAWSVVAVLNLILQIYYWSILAVIVLSWIAQGSHHPAVQLLMQITEPVMAPFRKLIPPIGGLDLSPIVVFLVLNVASIMINHLAAIVGLGQLGIHLG